MNNIHMNKCNTKVTNINPTLLKVAIFLFYLKTIFRIWEHDHT